MRVRIVAPLLVLALVGGALACGSATPTASNTTAPGTLTALPLGDGHVSTSPKAGYVYSCQTTFGGGGATGSAPWISGSTWDLTAKPTVQGSVSWPNARISIARSGADRVVSANNLPTHTTGTFPIARTDPAYQYDANPNAIAEQTVLLHLPATPAAAASPGCVPMGMIGFTLTGAALYNALDAGGRDAAAHEVQDHCAGHPQRVGQYHYHSWSDCMADAAGAAGAHSALVGYALDGYGIYGLHGADGKDVTNADLDACHGHTHAIEWDGQTVTLYHYHMTREYPYSVGCYHGTPVGA